MIQFGLKQCYYSDCTSNTEEENSNLFPVKGSQSKLSIFKKNTNLYAKN